MNDADNDGVLDVIDNSPGIANANQLDTDKDNVGMPVTPFSYSHCERSAAISAVWLR